MFSSLWNPGFYCGDGSSNTVAVWKLVPKIWGALMFVGFLAGQKKQVNLQNVILILIPCVCYNSCSQVALRNTNLCSQWKCVPGTPYMWAFIHKCLPAAKFFNQALNKEKLTLCITKRHVLLSWCLLSIITYSKPHNNSSSSRTRPGILFWWGVSRASNPCLS